MARAENYRRYAAACLAFAQRSEHSNDRAKLLEMARALEEFAVKAASENHQVRE